MKVKVLSMLKGFEFVSGERIAEELGVSRTAVWKHIRSLSALGYEIESQKNKGYRLVSVPDIPLPEEILPELGTEIIGRDVIYQASTGSTNTLGKKMVRDRAPEGTVIAAGEQNEGRGRMDRKWSSPEGGLWFSVVLYPDLPPERAMLVTMLCSISISEAVKEVTGIETVIKWPNDLLVNGKKVCGILTEMEAEMDRITSCVVGIGLNVNNDLNDELCDIGTSLKKEKGERVPLVKLMRSILKRMDAHYDVLKKGEHDLIREMWKKLACISGRKVKVSTQKETIVGKIIDIDISGCLILSTDTERRRIVCGDVEYL
ncbi:MAG: biotin--[acetyl-CoA-carboxylase] ligase [Candidatus Thermoplasmatota archaeon]|nr:biotin--[acetyl-CoA-carboxylase] ligase [Candidatus Thermoplasmatota archaeon]